MKSFIHSTYAVLRRELHRIFHWKIYLVLMFVLPAISFFVFSVIFHNSLDTLPIAVFDQDNTPLSRQLTTMVDETPTAQVAYEIQDIEEGMSLMRQGKIYAILQIPAFFEKNILSNTQTNVEFYNSGCNITINGLLEKDVQTTVKTFSTGIQLQLLQSQGLTARQAMALALPINFDKHILFNPYINYSYYLAPCFLAMMLLIFTVLLTVYAIGTELKFASAKEWLDTADGSIWAAVIGKLLPTTIAMFLMTMVMYVVVFKVIGAPMNGSATMLILSALVFILSYQSIGILFVAVFDNLRLALSFGGGYSVLAFTFSGLTFPTMAMYPAMQWFSYLFPFTFYMRIYVDIAMRGAPVMYALSDLACMMLFLIPAIAVMPRLKTLCSDEKYWGKL